MTDKIEKIIEKKLKKAFALYQYLTVENESHMHASKGLESHFKVVIVSDDFVGKRSVKRHQAIYRVLNIEIKKIHALSLHVFTKSEWKNNVVSSPLCAH